MNWLPRILAGLCAVLALLSTGCSKAGDPAAKGGAGGKPQLLAQAEAKENAGDAAGALALYEQALKAKPDDAALHVHIAQAAYKLNEPARGLQAIARLMTLDFPGKDIVELRNLKATFEAMKNGGASSGTTAAPKPSSGAILDTATALAVQTAKAALDDAQAAAQRRDAERALKFAREARAALQNYVSKIDQSDVELWYQTGRAALVLEDDQLAARTFEAIQRLRPDYAGNETLLKLMAQLNRRPISTIVAAISAERPKYLENEAKRPHAGQSFTNSFGMVFLPVPGVQVLFSKWETRKQDYAAYATASGGVDESWRVATYKNKRVSDGPNHPVVNVNWEDAQRFCRWLTETERVAGRIAATDEYRLPTEMEWSYAVGISDGDTRETRIDRNRRVNGVFPWGREWPPPNGAGNFGDETLGDLLQEYRTNHWILEGYKDGFATTAPVGSFPANIFGLRDLSGNVCEWCDHDSHSGMKEDYRAVRGGSWRESVRFGLQSWVDKGVLIGHREVDIGFRVVLSVPSAP